MKPVFAFSLGVDHPSTRLRLAAYTGPLHGLGWDLHLHHFDPGMGGTAPRAATAVGRAGQRLRRAWRTARAVAALRRLPPGTPVIISRELPVSRRPFLSAPNPLILDIDDALYLGAGRGPLLQLCQRAELVVCGNRLIAQELAGHCRRCVVIPTVVDPSRYQVREPHTTRGILRLGWLGTSMSMDQTLRPFLGVLTELRRQLPFELVVIADQPLPPRPGGDWIRFVKWSPAVETTLADRFDIGLMPLQSDAYQQAKCGAKLLQYMAAGLPVIATPAGVNREIVLDGKTGYWATEPADWVAAVHRLALSPSRRAELGRAGREQVVQNYSVAGWAPVWGALLNQLAPGGFKPGGPRR